MPDTAEPPDNSSCLPCRGTGHVLSNLGGEPKLLTCPWCRGGGVRLEGVDAQENAPHVPESPAEGPDSAAQAPSGEPVRS